MIHTDTPIKDTLQAYLSNAPIRMHVPFHNGIANNPVFPQGLYGLDISEVSGYDVEGEDNPIFQSEQITADFFSVSHSFYLVGGASVGLLASMLALRKYGKKVILARNVHKSVINGVILAGLEPVWLEIDFLSEWGIFSKINPEKLEKLLKENNDIAGCVIVSPTYEGVISDVRTIADICHKKNVPFVVDEAHGAHLKFLEPTNLRAYEPMKDYADLIIQSWHKSLGALTQTGVLHLASEKFFSYKDIKKCLDLVSSTSPSFLLLLSIELTRKHLAEFGSSFLKGLFVNSNIFREKLKAVENICILENDDPFKVYLKPRNISGIDFAYELYKNYAVEIESANDVGFLMMIGVSFNDSVMNKVLDALNNVNSESLIVNRTLLRERTRSTIHDPRLTNIEQLVDPRKAFFQGLSAKGGPTYGGKDESMEYECEIQAPCPPGYVISIPGIKK